MNTEALPMAPSGEAGALFNTYHDRIYRYVLSLVHDPAEAEDLTQDTFLRAYTHRDSLRDPNAVRGWLYRIATHACLDRLRQRVAPVSLDGEEGARAVDSVPSKSPSALEIAEREETGVCVQRCLDFLSDSYRAVILLHEAHSLTAPEIAELLGETVGTIKIRLHRARRKLQEIMQIGCAVSQSKDGVPCCEPKLSGEPQLDPLQSPESNPKESNPKESNPAESDRRFGAKRVC
jgi:RNA polymerase sigma-70 factor (ECF subfamily)